MKNLKVVLLAVLTAVGLAGCGECQHVDDNHDHKCDKCGVVMSQCEDKDPKDHLCDWCGAKVSEHEAVAGSHNCGICGEKLSEHKDENKDHKCDICGEKLSEHHAADGSHNCEYCGEKISEHKDENKDHNCDICGEKLSEHHAADGSHNCEYCGAKLTEHVDAMHDGTCDICGEAMEVVHVDPGHDGICDVCGAPVAVHHVDDGTGYCSCGKKIVLESAVLNVDAAKKVYGKDQLFDNSGVKVIGTYTDEQVKEVPCTCSTPDMSTAGTKEITVTYLDKDGAEQHFYFNIEVTYWSEGDLEIIDEATLLGYADPLPYLPGMRIETDLVEETWNVIKEDSSLDEVDQYWELMNDYSVVASISGRAVNYEMVEFPTTYLSPSDLETINEVYGFSEGNFYVFYLIPSYEAGEYGTQRFFVGDEYFIFGLTDEGDFKLYDRFVEAYWDGYWDGNENCDMDMFDVSKIKAAGYNVKDDFLSELGMIPYYYFSELAGNCLTFPDMENDTGYLIFNSYKTIFPFDFYFDDFAEVVSVDLINGTEKDCNDFITELLELGYVADVEYPNVYSYSNEYVGTISFDVIPFSEDYVSNVYGSAAAEELGVDAGFGFTFYYAAPERDDFITILTPALDSLLELFGENVNYLEINTDYYDGEGEGEIIADFYVVADEAPLDSEAVEASLAALLPAGFYSYGPAEYNSEYECWEEEFTNGTYGVYLSVFDADDDGDCEVYLEFYYGEEIIETFTDKMVAVAEAFTGSEITPFSIPGGYSMSAVVGATGGEDTAESLLDVVYNGYVYCGLVEEGAEPEEFEPDDWGVTVLSYDGQFEVSFEVFNNDLGDYVCSITIVSAAPWAGTPEEGFLAVMNALEMPEEYYAYAKTLGYLTWYDAVPVSYASAALNQTLTDIEGYLPRGVEFVGKDPDSNTFYYQSADGSVTFIIEVGVYYEDETQNTVYTSFAVNVILTPAE